MSETRFYLGSPLLQILLDQTTNTTKYYWGSQQQLFLLVYKSYWSITQVLDLTRAAAVVESPDATKATQGKAACCGTEHKFSHTQAVYSFKLHGWKFEDFLVDCLPPTKVLLSLQLRWHDVNGSFPHFQEPPGTWLVVVSIGFWKGFGISFCLHPQGYRVLNNWPRNRFVAKRPKRKQMWSSYWHCP